MGRRALLGIAIPLALALAPVPVAIAAPGDPPITGSGSTWAQNALDQWRRNIFSLQGLTVHFAGTGSTQGRTDFRSGNVDFAISDLEYGVVAGDPPPTTRDFAYLPLVAGGTAFAYNLRIGTTQVTNLELSGDTIAKIFTRRITSWDDPAIRADNPGLALPAQAIIPVVRSDGAATTLQLTPLVGRPPSRCLDQRAYGQLPADHRGRSRAACRRASSTMSPRRPTSARSPMRRAVTCGTPVSRR